MSQHVVYKCDADDKEIGKQKHITLMLNGGTGTGIAVPPDPKKGGQWHTVRMPGNFLHFHDEKCLGKYFKKLLDKAKQ